MKGSKIAGWAFITVLSLVGLAVSYRTLEQDGPTTPKRAAVTTPTSADEAHQSFLYGRVSTIDGVSYEGRLRWGGHEEAFWGNYFNGVRKENPWVAHIPPEQLPKDRQPIEIFGIKIASREHPIDPVRLFMARFGDIARIDASAREVQVTLKSGTVFRLDRFEASDFDDGVRVWDGRGAADLDSLRIRAIEFLPGPRRGTAPARLHGTVHTQQGDFTGFVQWDREQCIGSDEFHGETADGELKLRFDTIRSIARRSRDNALLTLLDGREIKLSGEIGQGTRGVYVDDPRYGRVLISWNAFENVDFSPGGSGPAYGDFAPGGPLTGTVTTRAGRRLTGRLVYDLDESEITETLDAPSHGVDYTIPLGLIASIVLPDPEQRRDQRARVRLHSGEELQLDCMGDLGERNAGILIFVEGRQSPEYVPWTDVGQVELNRPSAM